MIVIKSITTLHSKHKKSEKENEKENETEQKYTEQMQPILK